MVRTLTATLLAGALSVGFGAPAAGLSRADPERFTVVSDGHPMAVWARVPASPHGAVLLVHGRTWSSRPDFDLQVDGDQRSVMTSLASRGLATYAVDLRGYGGTPRDASGWATPRQSATDVLNVLAWISTRHADLPRPTLVGWSRGAAIGMLAAQMAPAQVSGLVMFGFVYDPDSQFADPAGLARPARLKNTPESARSDFITPPVTPPAVVQAFVAQALAANPILVDVRGDAEFNDLNPAVLRVPTLVIYGARDPGVSAAEAAKFFVRLGPPDKEVVVLPGADHAAQLEDTHDAWVEAVVGFLDRPRAGHR